ncbi:MAG: hypothetical protein K2Y27_16285 [Xanthobacteraceae bacterium]|nr:hypothetical protein [Xanthobacteraceae bacterium]
MARRAHNPAAKHTTLVRNRNDGTTHRQPAANVAPLSENMQRALADDDAARNKSRVRSRRRVSDRRRRKKKTKKLYKEMTAEQRWASAQAAAAARSAAKDAGVPKAQLPKVEDWQQRLLDHDFQNFVDLPPAEYAKLSTPEDRPIPPPPYIAKRLDYKRYVEERLSEGFVIDRACSLGDRPYLIDEFCEEGLRSEHDWTLYRFVWDTPAAENRRRGNDAAEMFLSGGKHSLAPTDGKMRGLDQSHIVRTRKFRRVIRVELDIDFDSIGALVHALRHIAKLPILPNVVAFNRTLDGAVGGAHLWFELAGEPVWFSDDKRCSKDARLLYRKVVTALTKTLKAIGADMAGAVAPTAGKNPLAPVNCAAVLNDGALYSLKQWADWLGPHRLKVDLAHEIREAVLAKADADGVERRVSQPLFLASRDHAWKACALACESDKGEFGKLCKVPPVDRARLRDLIFDALLAVVDEWEAGATRDKGKRKLLLNVSNAVAKEWDPKKRSGKRKRKRNRGLMRGGLEHLDNPHDRQSAGATMHTHVARRVETVWKCSRALAKLGPKASFKVIAEEAGIRQARTVSRNWTAIETAQHLTEKSALWTLLGGYEGIPASTSNSAKPFVNQENADRDVLKDFDLVVEGRDRPLLRLKADVGQQVHSSWIMEFEPGVVRHNPNLALPVFEEVPIVGVSGETIDVQPIERIDDVPDGVSIVAWAWWDDAAAHVTEVEESVRSVMSRRVQNETNHRFQAIEAPGAGSPSIPETVSPDRSNAVPGALARRWRRRRRIARGQLTLIERIGRGAQRIEAIA